MPLFPGLLAEELKAFLETNLPQKKSKVQLGVCDSKLGAAINEALGVSVTHVGVVPEVRFSGAFMFACLFILCLLEFDNKNGLLQLSQGRVTFPFHVIFTDYPRHSHTPLPFCEGFKPCLHEADRAWPGSLLLSWQGQV